MINVFEELNYDEISDDELLELVEAHFDEFVELIKNPRHVFGPNPHPIAYKSKFWRTAIFKYFDTVEHLLPKLLSLFIHPDPEVVKFVLEMDGPSLIPRDVIAIAATSKEFETVDMLLGAGGKFHPNMRIHGVPLLAHIHDPVWFEKLIKMGADVNATTWHMKPKLYRTRFRTILALLLYDLDGLTAVDGVYYNDKLLSLIETINVALKYGAKAWISNGYGKTTLEQLVFTIKIRRPDLFEGYLDYDKLIASCTYK